MTDQPSSPLAGEVARIIRLADASSFAGWMGKLLLGLGVCIGAGIFLDIVLLVLFGPVIGWTGWFWLYVLASVPLIIWYERKSRQHEAVDIAVPADRSIFSRAVSPVIAWGPGSLIDGLRGLFGRRSVLQNAVLDRAVLLVLDLNVSSNRVEIKKLIIPPEDMKIFSQAVDMLLALDLAGRSTDGTSLWLISTFRQKLQNFARSA